MWKYSIQGKKIVDWQKCFLANLSGSMSVRQIAAERLSLPGEYVAITTDTGRLAAVYKGISRAHLIKNDLVGIKTKNDTKTSMPE